MYLLFLVNPIRACFALNTSSPPQAAWRLLLCEAPVAALGCIGVGCVAPVAVLLSSRLVLLTIMHAVARVFVASQQIVLDHMFHVLPPSQLLCPTVGAKCLVHIELWPRLVWTFLDERRQVVGYRRNILWRQWLP